MAGHWEVRADATSDPASLHPPGDIICRTPPAESFGGSASRSLAEENVAIRRVTFAFPGPRQRGEPVLPASRVREAVIPTQPGQHLFLRLLSSQVPLQGGGRGSLQGLIKLVWFPR